jgi:hypothetical protein
MHNTKEKNKEIRALMQKQRKLKVKITIFTKLKSLLCVNKLKLQINKFIKKIYKYYQNEVQL